MFCFCITQNIRAESERGEGETLYEKSGALSRKKIVNEFKREANIHYHLTT